MKQIVIHTFKDSYKNITIIFYKYTGKVLFTIYGGTMDT